MLPWLGRGASTRQNFLEDWCGALPAPLMDAYHKLEQRWNTLDELGSVALCGAKKLGERNEARKAAQQCGIAGEFLNRLADELITATDIMQTEARHFPIVPTIEPMAPTNYRSMSVRWSISLALVLHQVTFSERNRFFNKLRALDRVVEVLCDEFLESVDSLLRQPERLTSTRWDELERLDYDLNTCLQEGLVVLKCFLRAVPKETSLAIAAHLDAPISRRARPARRATEVSV